MNPNPNNPTAPPAKPTFIQLRDQCHFDILGLAQQAAVHPEIVYRMLLHEPVPRDSAVKVLNAYSEHAGAIYTLDAVDVPLATL